MQKTTAASAAPGTASGSAAPASAGILVVSAYVAAQMLADITSLKIARVGSFSVDGGMTMY